MSGKLDQSLDQIMKDTRKTRAPRATVKKTKVTMPAGGITKKAATAKTARKGKTATKVAAVVAAAAPNGESKIQVTGLPLDVDERMVKEYFSQTIGHVRRAIINYGPNGVSRGQATVIFSKADGAVKAVKNANGLSIDNRKIKIEIIGGDASAPVIKSLAERVTPAKGAVKAKANTKAKGKVEPKAAVKAANGQTKKADGAGKPRKGNGGRGAGRGKPKTAEELDAEMTDYFGGANGSEPQANGAGQTNGGDATMADEIM